MDKERKIKEYEYQAADGENPVYMGVNGNAIDYAVGAIGYWPAFTRTSTSIDTARK